MKITNSNERKFGVILQYVQMGISILIQLIYTPIMLKILGDNEYGIYNVSSSIISYLSLLSLGFGASYLRYYSIYKQNGNGDKIKYLNGMYLSVFIIIGIVALIIGLLLSFNVSIFYNDTYSSEDLKIAKNLMIFLSINLAVSFPSSVFVSYISSQEKFVWQKIINMASTILAPATSIILLYCGFGSIGMVVTITCISIIVMIMNIWFCFKKLSMKVSFRKFDFKLFKSIFIFSIFIAMNEIVNQLNLQTDKIILGKMTSGTIVSIYAVGSNISAMFTQFSTAISNVFSPKVNMIVQKNNDDMDKQLTNLFIKVGRVQWFLLMLILTGFVFFGQFFISKWAGDGYSNAYYVALLIMIPNSIPLCQNIGIEIQRAKNKHQIRSIVYLITAIINVLISVALVRLWGEIGAAIGTSLTIIGGPIFFMNIYYQLKLGINVIKFWKSILKSSISFIIPIIFGVGLMKFYTFKGIIDFCLLITLYVVIYAICIGLIGLNSEEKNLIKSIFIKIFCHKQDKKN